MLKSIGISILLLICFCSMAQAQVKWKLTHTGSLFSLYSIESSSFKGNEGSESIHNKDWSFYGGGYSEEMETFFETDGTMFLRLLIALSSDKGKLSDNVDASAWMFRWGWPMAKEKIAIGIESDWRMISAPSYDISNVWGLGLFAVTEVTFIEIIHTRFRTSFLGLFTDDQNQPVDGSALTFGTHVVVPIVGGWGLSYRLEYALRTFKGRKSNSDSENNEIKATLVHSLFGIGYSF